MTIQIKCPHCGHAHRVKDEAAGRKFRCKGCEEILQVPKPKSASKSAGGQSQAAPRPTQKKKKRPPTPVDESFDDFGDEFGTDEFGGDEWDDYDDDYGAAAPPAALPPAPSRSGTGKKTSKKRRSGALAETGKKWCIGIACFLIALETFGFVSQFLIEPKIEGVPQELQPNADIKQIAKKIGTGLRLLLMIGLSVALIQGQNWARWSISVLCILGLCCNVLQTFGLLVLANAFPELAIWIVVPIVLFIVNVATAVLLLALPSVRAYCGAN